MKGSKIDRVRGTTDWLPDQVARMTSIRLLLESTLQGFGYRPLDVPVIEHTDLYLKKAGEDVITRLYDFSYRNRRLTLRPELTASITRAYVDNLQDHVLPVRLYHAGPVFRYEKPGGGRYRQFTQIGVELIGASGPMADAELIYAAAKGLIEAGIDDFLIQIGHVGILNQFFRGLTLKERTISFLVAQMEPLRKGSKADVIRQVGQLYGFTLPADMPPDGKGEPPLPAILSRLTREEARVMVLELLTTMNIDLEGSRDPDQIVDRLLEKMAHHEQIAGISRALDFMEELSTLSGPPDVVINRARDLLARYGIDPSPLDDLAETLTLLAEYQLLPHLIQLDLGLSRGLTYYTGMVFEIYQTEDGDLRQLCGGGRYDDLVGTLGGPPDVCAAGFSYGLERVYLAKQGADEAPPSPVDALIIPVEDADRPAMLHIAEKLRATGLRVEVSVRERGLRAGIRYADRCAIPFVIILGPEERSAGKAVLRDMARREEQQVDMDTLGELIKGKR